MKKILCLILPALFLTAGAGNIFAQSKKNTTMLEGAIKIGAAAAAAASKSNKNNSSVKGTTQSNLASNMEDIYKANKDFAQKVDTIKQEQQKHTQQIMQDVNILNRATEITPGQKIDLQDILFSGNEEKPETKYYKLKLAKDAKYVLLDQKTFAGTKENSVSWLWNDFLGKYEYAFNFQLFTETETPYLLIVINPVLSKDNEPTLPVIHVAFNFNEKGDITYGGHAYAIDGHGGFDNKLAVKVK